MLRFQFSISIIRQLNELNSLYSPYINKYIPYIRPPIRSPIKICLPRNPSVPQSITHSSHSGIAYLMYHIHLIHYCSTINLPTSPPPWKPVIESSASRYISQIQQTQVGNQDNEARNENNATLELYPKDISERPRRLWHYRERWSGEESQKTTPDTIEEYEAAKL